MFPLGATSFVAASALAGQQRVAAALVAKPVLMAEPLMDELVLAVPPELEEAAFQFQLHRVHLQERGHEASIRCTDRGVFFYLVRIPCFSLPVA